MSEAPALRLLRVAGSAVLVLFVAMMSVNPGKPVEANTPGFVDPVVGLELASRPEHVFGILGAPAAPARADTVRRMVRLTRLDFLFLIAYPAFHLGMAWLLLARGGVPRSIAVALVLLPIVMVVGDALENLQILVLTDLLEPEPMVPVLARLRFCTVLKWAALCVDGALLGALIWRQPEWWRWSAPLFALGAILGFLAVAHPPAIEWSMVPIGIAWAMTLGWAFGRDAASPDIGKPITAAVPDMHGSATP